MDKSAKHEAKYYEWISNSRFIRFIRKRKYKNKEFREQKISLFKKPTRHCLYSRIYKVASVLIRRSYVPDKTLSVSEERRRKISYVTDQDNFDAVWEEATKIVL